MDSRILGAAAVAVLVFAPLAQAAPVQFKDVPAEAKWLVHVDADAARSSTVMQRFYQECIAGSGLDACFDKMAGQCAMDSRKDLHSLTLYGTNLVPGKGVLILRGQLDKARLDEAAQKSPDHAESKHGDHTIHTWTHEHGGRTTKGAGALVQPDVLVLASDEELLKKAIDVLDGGGKALAEDSPLGAAVPDGTFFLVRAVGIDQSEVAAERPLLAQLHSIDLARGEHDGKVFGHLTLTATSEESAKRFQSVLEGFRSMVLLHLGKAPELGKLLDSVQFQQEGNTVKADFEAPADQVAQAMTPVCQWIKKHWAAKLARMQAAGEGRHGHEAKGGEEHHGKEHGDGCPGREGGKCKAHEHGDHRECRGRKCEAHEREGRREGRSDKGEAHERGDRREGRGEKDAHEQGDHDDAVDRGREGRGEKDGDEGEARQSWRERRRAAREAAEQAGGDEPAAEQQDQRQRSVMLGVAIGKPEDGEGADVLRVRWRSPAARAGLENDDRIVKIDDQAIASPEQLRDAVRQHKAGDRVKLTVVRGGEQKEIEVELGESEESER